MDPNTKIDNLIEFSEKPLNSLKTIGKNGVKGLATVIILCAVLALVNLIFFFIGVYRLYTVEYHYTKLIFLGISFLTGLGSVIFAAYRGYQYCVLETMKDIYYESKQVFYNISEKIIIQCETVLKSSASTSANPNLAQALQIKNLVEEKYKALPAIGKKGVLYLFRKIPMGQFLLALTEDIASGNRKDATEKLFREVDAFIQENIFRGNSMSWMRWLFLFTIILQIFIVWFLIV